MNNNFPHRWSLRTAAILVAATFLFSSCATLFSGTHQRITVDSSPPGATVIMDGQDRGVTPVTFKAKRDATTATVGKKAIRLEKDGYQTEGYYLSTHMNGLILLNFVNLFFWAIDAASGAAVNYDRHSHFHLIPEQEQLIVPAVKPTPFPAREIDDPDTIKFNKLRELKKLLDEGVLTQEEYEAEKKKILEK